MLHQCKFEIKQECKLEKHRCKLPEVSAETADRLLR